MVNQMQCLLAILADVADCGHYRKYHGECIEKIMELRERQRTMHQLFADELLILCARLKANVIDSEMFFIKQEQSWENYKRKSDKIKMEYFDFEEKIFEEYSGRMKSNPPRLSY